MNEIKVFLVEDEMVIRRGIKNSIDWEKEGYIFCGEASDGELAYPMIIKEKPDILITDIRMPFMDGLELCKLVKKELPNIKILILSGYDEFDYAKEAIRLGVTEYLLKPISSGKLLEALNGVSESIRREKEDKDLVRKYMEEMRENTEHEKQKFFEQMIAGNLSMADALETGKKYEMNLSAGMYNLLLFRFTLGEENRKSGELLGEAGYAIEKLTERLEYVFEFQRGVEGWAFLLMADNEEQMSERVKELSKDLEEIMKNYSTIAYFGGIGQPVARLRELEESFREAERALAARFTMELNRIISVEDIRMAQNVDTLDDIEITSFGEIEKTRTMLEKFLNNGAEDEIDEFVDVYINELPEENLKSVLMRQYIIMDAYIVMMSFCEKIEGIEGEMQAQSEELKNSMKTSQTLEEIKNYIRMLLKKIIGVRDTISGRRYSDIIEIAKDQIRKTYMSDEISLNTIAAEVGMSPSYFSSIFSKEMGKTFVEYLTEIRMDRAKELLMCSSMKTSEIGYEVGYKDPHYFSYIFKKTQNCTPKEFRARGKE
ncbi:response regulator [Dorea longicatena]|uniref:response regulator n=1 Tax=Dorea longicatena TaxID=88431 RepID=UPI0015700BFE|nr:response regulator [Dorea longicatena]NSC49189.1 response regulator [Dorea longicatena]NSD25409.1 response regulator [Dorea longicatena]NSD40955.1 response regulator [Dorea longicatena]NSD69979.1 response regulator [Dorea longicatena]NSD73094.1 response regulator [Dorea longicatena]